jgi:hypothetical protein
VSTLLDRGNIVWTPGLGQNDELDDCTLVALVNSIRAASLVKNGCDLAINWDEVVKTFAMIARVTPTLAAERTVLGLDPRDVIAYAMKSGVKAGLQAPLVLKSSSTSIPPVPTNIYQAMRGAGSAYIEIALTEADLQSAAVMDEMVGKVAGLHQTFTWDCTGLGPNDTVEIGTWGRWQYMTWRGLQARIQGAWKLDWYLP